MPRLRTSLDFHVVGTDEAPISTGGELFGSITEDAGPSATVNGGFETGDLDRMVRHGGRVGRVSGDSAEGWVITTAHLSGSGSLEQDIATTAGAHYTLSFYVAGDAEATSTSFTAYWDGAPILGAGQCARSAYTHYTFDVIGDALDPTTQFFIDYSEGGIRAVFRRAVGQPDAGSGDRVGESEASRSRTPRPATRTRRVSRRSVRGYVGTFSLDPVSESSGSGSVGWHFSVDNADIQFLAEGQSIDAELHGGDHRRQRCGSASRMSTSTLNGANDAPTGVGDHLISNAGANGSTFAPSWALVANDTDPDTIDTLAVNSVGGASGGSAVLFGEPIFTDDATLGGSFTYDAADNHGAVSGAATVTVTNLASTTTTLVGTGGNDIIVALNDGDTLQGGGGNDILIGIGNTHTMTGGSGDDVFAVEVMPSSPLTITDFNNTSDHDTIAINSAAFGGGLTPGQDLTFDFEFFERRSVLRVHPVPLRRVEPHPVLQRRPDPGLGGRGAASAADCDAACERPFRGLTASAFNNSAPRIERSIRGAMF